MSKVHGGFPQMEMDEPFYVRRRPEPFSLWQFLYNSDKGTVMGRSGKSWVKIGIFYTVFYGVLAALVAICMWVFFQTLDPRIPKWKMNKSLIGTNPGLGFRPLPPEENVESTLIWYKVYKTPGLTPGRGQNIYNCDYQRPPPPGQVCDVEIKSWTPCTQENNYNYHKSSPCVFLKLNKIYGWIPEYYNDSHYLPDGMPQQLKDLVREEEVKTPHTLNTIWVSCEGENPADIENVGPVRYYPRQGFPGYFYPYENSEGYLSPLVAVHFVRPVRGIIINIECKAWAKNIHHDRKERIGSVHFELMID
uniref:Putative sodium/potassium-transporting atpase subunit beta-2 n=1 Tax=Lutzomyia longipalpis TaxID=7200 RepID=A0A1B0GI31_LUTLO